MSARAAQIVSLDRVRNYLEDNLHDKKVCIHFALAHEGELSACATPRWSNSVRGLKRSVFRMAQALSRGQEYAFHRILNQLSVARYVQPIHHRVLVKRDRT